MPKPKGKKKYSSKYINIPIANKFGRREISLPITPLMTMNDLDYIIEVVKKHIKN